MHSFLGLIVRGVLAVYLLQQVHKTWWKHYFWITFCCSLHFYQLKTGTLISTDLRLVGTLCHLNVGLCSCHIAVKQTVCSREFWWLCTWLFSYFCGRFVPSLSLECGAKFVPIFFDANSMFTLILMTLYVIFVLLFLRSFCAFFVTWTRAEVRANLLWQCAWNDAESFAQLIQTIAIDRTIAIDQICM